MSLSCARSRRRDHPSAVAPGRANSRMDGARESPGGRFDPSRLAGPAVRTGGWALAQLWLFWLAPLLDAGLAGAAYRWLAGDGKLR